ncbi:hypothetical protein PVAG01_04149 [Phlyctema vagabunda]|uniref:Uncharacterized protein n=1 Tax=Phlyctema vagabunda TaxID=108571 RepID=A0ABR4PNS8_9HELO
MQQLHINTLRNSFISTSPNDLPPQLQAGPRPETPRSPAEHSPSNTTPSLSRGSSTLTIQAAALAVGDEALKEFSRRSAHLFTLFRLSTESLKPISVCSLEELARAALWWFIKGRMDLEATVRDRPATPEAQKHSFFKRQQAHADLAKALWIVEQIMPQRPEILSQQSEQGPDVTDVVDAQNAVLMGLRKLTMSMQRNNFLPPDPDDAPLQQGLDPSIWVRDDGNLSLVSNQKNSFAMKLLDAFPLGDTNQIFSYSRIFVQATLMEEDGSQQYRSSCLTSVIRVQNEKKLRVLIASANGTINFCLQGDRTQGPIWEDVAWKGKSSIVDIRLPRGFLLRLQCDPHDFRALWAIYDYQNTIHASLFQQQNEEVAFETKVKSFQMFDQSPHSHAFPKEPVPGCQVRIFEKVLVEKAAGGTRRFHRGFRIAVVTGQKTKNLSGINQDFLPTLPFQFGFLRGEGGLPAFLLKIDDGKKKASMVFTFNEVEERAALHARLAGMALVQPEAVVAEVRLKEVAISSPSEHARQPDVLQNLDWQMIRIINEDEGDFQSNKTILSDSLRMVLDFKAGTFTDRINVGTGEMKLRLDVGATNDIKIIRQPQEDMTIALSEGQTPKDSPYQLTEVLQTVAKGETIRRYAFPTREELHLFQAALTGFKVMYDGNAISFNISRRRMVVPIYKKWDAATTRIQVIQREKVVQLVAFFENFNHGDCMNFILKGTDIFETSSKSSKYYLKIVDAKFAMPKPKPAEADASHVIDSGYVCLDMPEYPGEHDDITIVFGSEVERNHFTQALPAPVKGASRMGSIKR